MAQRISALLKRPQRTPNGIYTHAGAKYKVYEAIGNITGAHVLIRHTRVGLRFSEHCRRYQRRLQPRDPPRSSERPCHYLCRICTCAPRGVRTYTATKRPDRISWSRTRSIRRWKDHAPQALAVDAIQPGRSPLSRFEAAERRSREHGSDHTDVCRHGDELAASLLLTKLVQPPSSAEAAKPCGRARVSGCQLQWRSKGGF